jgi:hypothetical protein
VDQDTGSRTSTQIPTLNLDSFQGVRPEVYAADGSKTEYIAYYTREDRRGQEYKHWW